MSDWQQVTLGRLFSVDNSKLGPHTDEPTVMSLSKYDGFVRADEYFDKRIASEKLDGYKTVGPGGWAYSTIHIDEGSIARNNLGEVGAISPMYTTLRWRGEGVARPKYAELMVRSPRMLAEYANNAQGSVNRRRSLPFKVFSTLPITLPPLPVQDRIVEIVGAVDDQLTALDSEASTARKLLNMMLAQHFAAVEGEPHRIVDLCSHVVGGVWGKPQGEGEIDRLALGPRIYTPGTSDFVTDASPVRSFTTKQADTRTVQEQDIILERSGGSPEQPVGRVVIAGPDLEPCVPTDFQRLMRVDPEKALPRYVFWRLRHDWASGLTRNYSRRTTGITNLSVKEYIAREIPVPSSEEQAGLVERAEAVNRLIVTLRAEAAILRQVRASLLSGLLDRTINVESAGLEDL
ncbi:restriction endonuclease subunit S [Streptomyces sp. Edi4]|uniref:restriction endonuclease subunit S n=1 Tax=Streptomyces sp. Edi4 TaxID=3162527 RepID=UPI0033057262